MSLEVDQQFLQGSLKLLQWLGVTSVGSFLALYASWLAFPPELVIETVVDKSKKFNSESRIRIKNNGKLPALCINAGALNLCAVIGTNVFRVGTMSNNGPSTIARLSGGESVEISVSSGFGFEQGTQITEYSYTLVLKHHAKLFFFRKDFEKKWKVELRNFEDGFAWHSTPI